MTSNTADNKTPREATRQHGSRKPRRAESASSDVMTVEALAMRTGITGDQAQDLIDRLGNDREAIEEAARSLATGQQNFSK